MAQLGLRPGGMAVLAGLCLLALALLAAEALAPGRRGLAAFLSVAGLAAAGGALLFRVPTGEALFDGSLHFWSVGRAAAAFVTLAAAMVAALVAMAQDRQERPAGEVQGLLVFATLGLVVLSVSRDLIALFIGLEIASLALYALTLLGDRPRPAGEAALKYLLLGAFASAFLAMGIAFLYGATGALRLEAMGDRLAAIDDPARALWALLGFGFILAGMGFKLTLAPFHAYAPDVYKGASTPVAALIATASKVAGFAALASILAALRDLEAEDAGGLVGKVRLALWVLAAASMIVGNLMAVAQPNLKRMLAFSSVAHSGYLTVGLLAWIGGQDGAAGALILYLAAYTLMNLLAFGVAAGLGRRGETGITHYAGLARRAPLTAMAMAVAMLSLTGIPPTAGFAGKFYLFRAAVDSGYTGLVILAVLTSVWSAYYYLRVVVYMFMVQPRHEWEPPRLTKAGALALGVCCVLVLALGILPGALI